MKYVNVPEFISAGAAASCPNYSMYVTFLELPVSLAVSLPLPVYILLFPVISCIFHFSFHFPFPFSVSTVYSCPFRRGHSLAVWVLQTSKKISGAGYEGASMATLLSRDLERVLFLDSTFCA